MTTTSADTTDKDAPYVPTKQVVNRMLELAEVSKSDVVYDLGSGDGRIPITAAKKYGARGVGVEIDSELVAKARAGAQAAGTAGKVKFRHGDLFNADLSEAMVVTLYLWREINIKLRPKLLRELDPGDRIVAHDFGMGGWKPDRKVNAGPDKTGTATLYLWTVPKKVPDDLMAVSDELSSEELSSEEQVPGRAFQKEPAGRNAVSRGPTEPSPVREGAIGPVDLASGSSETAAFSSEPSWPSEAASEASNPAGPSA